MQFPVSIVQLMFEKARQRNKKRKRLVQPRQALEGRLVKSFFDFIGRTETSRGARRWS
ncbi:hypothetical protein [Mesobacillus boroniphilus]|uniref:hypothetical protein n=1 Tax=Mesobacillus boroniphilus TaxID=308892 RepID=UPI0012E224AD|nr:hypothetical protein [Mesobacillus boroniphilus]